MAAFLFKLTDLSMISQYDNVKSNYVTIGL